MSLGLRDYLESLFEDKKAISFEKFMESALYNERFGYYRSNIDTVGGERGDFSTSATVSKSFGEALAHWINTSHSHGKFDAIEIGAGSGAWLDGMMSKMNSRARRQARLKVVEISEVLQQAQRETLGWWKSRRVDWYSSIEDAIKTNAKCPVTLFSNELVDAFPVALLQWNGENGRWDEVHLQFDSATGLTEVFVPISESRSELDLSKFAALRGFSSTPPINGQRIEIHQSYREWLQKTVPLLPDGSQMLTIDYGHEDYREIYDKRPGGSLRAYQRRNRLTGSGVYRLFGRQDITADVNFTDLREWGEEFGLETIRSESQSDFLKRHLNNDARVLERETQYLLSEDGAGSAFRVLHQRK